MKFQYQQVKESLVNNIKLTYTKAIGYYQKLNKPQRIVLFLGAGLIALLLIILIATSHSTPKEKHTVQFATAKMQTGNKPSSPKLTLIEKTQLKYELAAIKESANQHYAAVNAQLRAVQSGLSNVASQESLNQIKQQIAKPNTQLMNKVSGMQLSLKKIEQQTQHKIFVSPKVVEGYFQLIAIQVFSDGMKAIIGIDNHQAILGANEVCPACRGWALQSMDFANQSAVFKNAHDQYVKLIAK